jgi:hypothetical protein
MAAKPSQIDELNFDLTAKGETGNAKAQFALGNFYEFGMIGPAAGRLPAVQAGPAPAGGAGAGGAPVSCQIVSAECSIARARGCTVP